MTAQENNDEFVRTKALAVRNLGLFMAPMEDTYAKKLVEKGVLQLYVGVIDSPVVKIRHEVVWSMRTVLVRQNETIQVALDLGLFTNILAKMTQDSDQGIRKNAIWAVSNALYKADATQAHWMASQTKLFQQCLDTLN